MQALTVNLARGHIKLDDALYLIPKHLYAHSSVVIARRENLYDITTYTKASALKRNVIAFITNRDELFQNILS